MKIAEYLSSKRRQLEKGRQRIQDFAVFDFNYIPREPLMREEVKPVIDALLRYRQTGIANNILVLGSRGSGKSVLARYLMDALKEAGQLQFVYANCRQHNTSFKILAAALGVRPRGRSLDELWQCFEDSTHGRVALVLDEVDLISDKDRRKDILYLASRSAKNFMLILLSNNPKFANSLDESTRSTLQPEIVHFRNYNALEIARILIDRARTGLRVPPGGAIDEIAALTAHNTNSDVRVAIRTLYLWALEPDVSIKEHFEKARRDIVFDVIRDLNDKNLMILKASLGPHEGFVKQVFDAYSRISLQLHEEPFSYVHFYSNLSYLQSLGLILLMSTKVNRTYTNRIQLAFDPAILETIWQTRFR